jgi:hypothetical protein
MRLSSGVAVRQISVGYRTAGLSAGFQHLPGTSRLRPAAVLGAIKQRYQNRHSSLYRENDRFSLHFTALKVTDKMIKFLSEKPGQAGFL